MIRNLCDIEGEPMRASKPYWLAAVEGDGIGEVDFMG